MPAAPFREIGQMTSVLIWRLLSVNALEIDASDPSPNGPLVCRDKAANSLDCPTSPKSVLARSGIEYVFGDMAEAVPGLAPPFPARLLRSHQHAARHEGGG